MWTSPLGSGGLHQVLVGLGKKGLEGDAEIRSAWASFLLLALGHEQGQCDGSGHQVTGCWLCIQKERKMRTDGPGLSTFNPSILASVFSSIQDKVTKSAT